MHEPDSLATGRAIILEIVRCLGANVEPLLYSTVVPARYFVYLHPSDFARLEGLLPRLAAEARRALDEEVARWNNEEAARRRSPLKWLAREKPAPPIEPPPSGWDIRFEPDAEGEMNPGDIAVASELTLPARAELSGSRTRRITTIRQGNRTTTREQIVDAATGRGGTILATLAYEDRKGRQQAPMTTNLLVVGRGGVGYSVDVRIDAASDVSREHLRIRRDEPSGRFFLKDMSTLGTTIDGVRVASSVTVVDGVRRDTDVEVPLPDRARIGLAEAVFIDFEKAAGA